jgi:3-(3-hydroxy-phenyl)propionate hydroxylase
VRAALAREGVKVVVCEAEPTLTHDLRAGSFHPPTQEMMAPYGITDQMHAHGGLQVRQWQIRSRRGGHGGGVRPRPARRRHALSLPLHLEQHRLTPIMLDILRKESNAEVHFGHRITGFEHRPHSVLVQFESEGIPGKSKPAG